MLLPILYAVLVLGGIGMIFGVILSVAAKKFHVEVDERIAQVRELLGGANCGACGFAGCDAFAEAVVNGTAPVNGCPAVNAAEVGAILGVQAEKSEPRVARVICQGECGIVKERYEYDGYRSCRMVSQMAGGNKLCRYACVGLGDCMDVCRFDAIHIENGLAVIDPKKCTSCGMCESACPRGVIKVVPRAASVLVLCRNSDSGRVARESCMKACIGCKRCEKVCKYDAIHVSNGFATIDVDKCTRCGECAENCPCGCIVMV